MQRATHLLTESTKRSLAKSSTTRGPTRATGATARTTRQNRGLSNSMPSLPQQMESTPTLQPGEKLIAIVPAQGDSVADIVGRAFNHKTIGRAYTINDSSVTVAVNEGKNLSRVSNELNGATVTEIKRYTPPDNQTDEGSGNGSTDNGENQNGKEKKPKDPFPAQGRVGGASARGGTPWGGGSVPSAAPDAAEDSDASSGGSESGGGSTGGSAAGDGRSRDPVVADVKPSDVAKVGAGASLFWLLLA